MTLPCWPVLLPWHSIDRLEDAAQRRLLGGDADTLACIAGAMAEAH